MCSKSGIAEYRGFLPTFHVIRAVIMYVNIIHDMTLISIIIAKT